MTRKQWFTLYCRNESKHFDLLSVDDQGQPQLTASEREHTVLIRPGFDFSHVFDITKGIWVEENVPARIYLSSALPRKFTRAGLYAVLKRLADGFLGPTAGFDFQPPEFLLYWRSVSLPTKQVEKFWDTVYPQAWRRES